MPTRTPFSDGQWLEHERDSDWREVARFSIDQTIEFSPESCFANASGAFCILRSYNAQNRNWIFLGCLIPPDQDEVICILVDRIESKAGAVVMKDDWSTRRILAAEKLPSIPQAIQTVRNYAEFNSYSTLPPYVLIWTMGLRDKSDTASAQQFSPPIQTNSGIGLPPCIGTKVATWTNCTGTLTWPEGQKYVGEFYKGEQNGQGTLTWPDGQKYVGEFFNGKMHGQGTHSWPSGQKYVGEFRDGKMHGQGTLTLPDGSVGYSGMWADGKPAK